MVTVCPGQKSLSSILFSSKHAIEYQNLRNAHNASFSNKTSLCKLMIFLHRDKILNMPDTVLMLKFQIYVKRYLFHIIILY